MEAAHTITPARTLTSRAVAVPLSIICRRPIQWLWSGWLARGTLTTVAGEPGIEKSTLLTAVATAVTTDAPLPGDTVARQPENVLLLASEDVEAEVVRLLSLPDDTQDLRDLLDMLPTFVILDSLVALETTGIDVYRQSAQRAVLAPLHTLAAEYQCKHRCVVHLKKGATDNVNHRVAGSIDLAATARTVWMVGEDPTELGRRAVAVSKSNLGPWPAPRRSGTPWMQGVFFGFPKLLVISLSRISLGRDSQTTIKTANQR